MKGPKVNHIIGKVSQGGGKEGNFKEYGKRLYGEDMLWMDKSEVDNFFEENPMKAFPNLLWVFSTKQICILMKKKHLKKEKI